MTQVHAPAVAVVGHVEWVQFARVAHVPAAGDVIHASDPFAEPAGGGAVAAVQLARLAGQALLITALGDDEIGERASARLVELGVDVRAVRRPQPTRTALTLLDDEGERTITTLGPRLEPAATDSELPWAELAEMDAVYFTAGDAGALRAARASANLVATPRARSALSAGVALDALVLSADDEQEREAAQPLQKDAALLVLTEGGDGGHWQESSGKTGSWRAEPTQVLDAYGCGDSFAAGLTYGLALGLGTAEAVAIAARCGARCLAGRGPYDRQLTDA